MTEPAERRPADPGGDAAHEPPPVPGRGGLAEAVGEQFSLEKSIGGVRGILESVVPITLFSVLYGLTHDLKLSCAMALIPSIGFAGWRLWRREPLTQALSGVIGVGIGAFLALRTGRSENFFLPSIIKNLAYGAAYALSALVRWPLVGVVLGFALGEMTHWRSVPTRLRAYSLATWVWVGMFGIRLAVQVPLYLLGMTATLGLASVPLGIPLFALVVYLTWLLVRRVPLARPPEPATESAAE